MNKSRIKSFINSILSILGFSIIKISTQQEILNNLNNIKIQNQKYNFLIKNNIKKPAQLLQEHESSKSQICQDWFVLDSLNYLKSGYFVEIGAASGVNLSNTYLLEKIYNWSGILCEPAKSWRSSLEKNRNCILDFDCVLNVSNKKIDFLETELKEYSTIESFINNDKHYEKRKKFEKYKVNSVSLEDLLTRHNAPKHIDYLSIDTEGSELEIIKAFNFNSFSFAVVTIEHNNTDNANEIDSIFASNGYKKVKEEFSQFESWFIKQK